MKVLEEFWYGNINPMERPFQSQRKFDKVFRLLAKNKEEWGFPSGLFDFLPYRNGKKLLKNTRTQLSISEVASSSGFENPLYFSRIFRNRTSMTPSEYRKKSKKSKI